MNSERKTKRELIEELRASRREAERFRSILDQTTDAIFCYEYDPPIPTDLPVEEQVDRLFAGVLVECNDAAARSYGATTVEEVLGRKQGEIFAGDREATRALFTRFIRDGYRTVDGEGVAVLPDGSRRHYRNSGHGVIEEGHLVRVWGTFRDVTERKRVEAEVLKEREFSGRLLDASPAFIVAIDPGGRTMMMNPAMLDALGYEPEEVIGMDYLETFVPERDRAYLARVFAEILRAQRTINENLVLTRDGREILVEWHGCPIRDPQGRVEYFFGVGIDVTERKAAERALRESEERIRRIFDESPVGLVEISPELVIQSVNPSVCRMMACEEADLVGRSVNHFSDPDDIPASLERWEKLLRGETPSYTVERPFRRKDGGLLWGAVTSFILRGEAGDPERCMSMIVDVTERKRAEEATLKAEQELQQQRALAVRADRLRSLGEMAAGIAHELNQPLMGVRGMAEHLMLAIDRHWDLPEEKLKERLESIVRQADRMSYIIDHARGFSRSAETADPEPVDVNEVVRSCVDLMGAQFRDRGLDLHLDLSRGISPVSGNPFALEEVALNLLVNARDAIGQDGEIRVRTGMADEDGVPWIILEVQDNGCGMGPEVMERALEPFFTTKGPQEGTGLGLTISRSIVERLGGTIDLASEVGMGATVTVRLPAPRGQG